MAVKSDPQGCSAALAFPRQMRLRRHRCLEAGSSPSRTEEVHAERQTLADQFATRLRFAEHIRRTAEEATALTGEDIPVDRTARTASDCSSRKWSGCATKPSGTVQGLSSMGRRSTTRFPLSSENAQEMGISQRSGASRCVARFLCFASGFPNGGRLNRVNALSRSHCVGRNYRSARSERQMSASGDRHAHRRHSGGCCRCGRRGIDADSMLGIGRDDMEIAWYDEGTPDEQTVGSGFDILSHF